LVRGTDEYGHFLLEPIPRSDFHPDALAFHSEMLAANDQILYKGATQQKDDTSTVRGSRASD
jgi:non-haem Fe2+, alpha-ketoglutarate-dependent halogenase